MEYQYEIDFLKHKRSCIRECATSIQKHNDKTHTIQIIITIPYHFIYHTYVLLLNFMLMHMLMHNTFKSVCFFGIRNHRTFDVELLLKY